MADFSEHWSKIVKIHNCTKSLFLWAEELDPELKSFTQPNNELKNALEHIVRSKARELGIVRNNSDSDEKESYIIKNLEKAIGHEYRGFFDTADWCCIILREKILNTLNLFSMKCICEVLPDYYSTDRARIENICKEIATLRNNKDINDGILKEVDYYYELIDELYSIWCKIRDKVEVLNDCEIKIQKESNKKYVSAIILCLLGAILGVVLTQIFKW